MKKVYFNISDMADFECRTQVKNALDKVKGVKRAV